MRRNDTLIKSVSSGPRRANTKTTARPRGALESTFVPRTDVMRLLETLRQLS